MALLRCSLENRRIDKSWNYAKIAGGHCYSNAYGSVLVMENPWRIELRDASGKLLTKTNSPGGQFRNLPTGYAVLVRATKFGLFAERGGVVLPLARRKDFRLRRVIYENSTNAGRRSSFG